MSVIVASLQGRLAHNRRDLTGKRFGRLLVLGQSGKYIRKLRWDCLCDCGEKVNVIGCNLTNGLSKSCGCGVGDATALKNHQSATHGLGGTPTYETWYGILDRCLNQKCGVYHNYGARGVKVCKFIAESPLNFVAVVGIKPGAKREFSIDRRDTNGHYSCGRCDECKRNGWPMNLRWATQKEQMRNIRNNRLITIGDRTQCLAAWAEEFGLKPQTIRSRINSQMPQSRWLLPLFR